MKDDQERLFENVIAEFDASELADLQAEASQMDQSPDSSPEELTTALDWQLFAQDFKQHGLQLYDRVEIGDSITGAELRNYFMVAATIADRYYAFRTDNASEEELATFIAGWYDPIAIAKQIRLHLYENNAERASSIIKTAEDHGLDYLNGVERFKVDMVQIGEYACSHSGDAIPRSDDELLYFLISQFGILADGVIAEITGSGDAHHEVLGRLETYRNTLEGKTE